MDLQKIAPFLKTSRPTAIFEKIIRFNANTENHSNWAMVRIGLASGFILEGVPIQMDTDKNVVFLGVDKSIGYVNVTTLAGVEVLNPEVLMEILTDGSYFEVPKNGIPTNLELKRVFKQTSDTLERLYGIKVKSEMLENGLTSEAEKFQCERFLKIFQEALGVISKDSLGKEVLSALKEINISSSEERLNVIEANKHLELGVNFKNKFTTDFQDRLKIAIESKL